MKKFLAFLSALLIFGVGCKGSELVNDSVPPSIASKYYNGEFYLDGELNSGIKVFEPEIDSNPADHELSIYGAYEGDISITSRKCAIEKSVHYGQGELITFKFSDLLDKFTSNCFITIVVTPALPEWDDSTVAVHGYMTGIYLRVKPEDFKYELKTNFGKVLQLRDREGEPFTALEGPLVIVNSTPGVKFAAFHCKNTVPLEMEVPEDGLVSMDVDGLHNGAGCLVQFKDKAGGFTPFVISVFSNDFIPLSEPSIVINKKKLKVSGSQFVSLTDINGEMFLGNEAKVSYDNKKLYTVRQYTTKGRTVVCTVLGNKKDCKR